MTPPAFPGMGCYLPQGMQAIMSKIMDSYNNAGFWSYYMYHNQFDFVYSTQLSDVAAWEHHVSL